MMDTPKNIRQIGNIDISHKIYVEDYVVTYTKSIGEELKKCGDYTGKAAVLLGHKKINDKDVETYINGLAMISRFGVNAEAGFSNEMWSSIYDVIKTYYDDEEIVGWLYIGETIDAGTDKRLVNIHNSNFNGKNLVFMYYNVDDKEEEFFDYMNNSFIRRKGFYIYYQKNDTMHNYMVAMNNRSKNETDCDDHVVKDMRNILNRRREQYEAKKMMKSVYAAGMLVAAVALLVGTTVIYNYNSEQNAVKTASNGNNALVEEAKVRTDADGALEIVTTTEEPVLTDAAETAEIPAGTEVPDVTEIPSMSDALQVTQMPAVSENSAPTETPAATQEPVIQSADATTEAPAEKEDIIEDNNKSEKSEESEAVSAKKTYTYYTVKEGDTLSTISEKIYSSVYYINKIKELNGIEDEDTIYFGQRLILPER